MPKGGKEWGEEMEEGILKERRNLKGSKKKVVFEERNEVFCLKVQKKGEKLF